MTTTTLLVLAYGLPTLISFIRLALDKETTSFKAFLQYWYFPFIPVYNIVMTGFIIKDLWLWDRIVVICCFLLLALMVLTYNLI